MHVGVLASSDSWYCKDLQRAAGKRYRVTPVTFSQLGTCLGGGHDSTFRSGEHNLSRFDAVLVRTMPPGSLEQVVFRMDVLARLEAEGQVIINPPKAIEIAVDKYLATAKLRAAGFAVPKTVVCQSVEDAMAGFEQLGGDVVIKPLFGSEGRGMTRVSDEALALRAFKTLAQLDAVIYLQQFIPHEGFDLRLLVLGERVLAMRRRNPTDWRTNVSRGATTERYEPDDAMCQSARSAAKCIGAPFAGVDILPGRDGVQYLLEVNAVPGWKALARTWDVDVARLALEYLEALVADRSTHSES